MDFKLEQKLIDLGNVLVPQHFQDNSPQFYQLILSFLRNLQNVQDSININLLDTIDITKINNDDIVSIYMDTYMSQLNLDDDTYPSALSDLLLVSKDLSTKKGTIQLYKIMLRLAVYLIDSIKTQYQILEEKINNETNEANKVILQQELDLLKLSNYKEGFFEYYQYDKNDIEYVFDSTVESNESLIPFKYHIKSDITKDIFEKYVKPFCHPLGWIVEFTQVLATFIEEEVEIYCRFNLTITKNMPHPEAGAGYTSGNTNENYTKTYDIVEIGDIEQYDYFKDIIEDESKLSVKNNKVYYNNDGISTVPPYIEIDIDELINRKVSLDLIAGYEGLKAGQNNLVAGNTNYNFPLAVLPFKYIPNKLYTGENYITKENPNVNKPVYIGDKLPIKADGTTDGSKYIKENGYNQVFDFVVNPYVESKVGTRYTSAGGGQVAGRKNSFYSKELVDDKKRFD